MRRLRGWLVRLAGVFAPRDRDRELAEELESHLQLHVDDNLRRGLAPDEARRQALLALGGVAQTAERYRDQHGIHLLDTLRQDFVYAVRTLSRNRGFAITSIVTLALGIGANTAIFSVVNAVLLRPLPFSDPSRLVMIFATQDRTGPYDVASYPDFVDWRNESRSFDALAAFVPRSFMVSPGNDAVLVQGKRVSAGLFAALGATPALGRAFRAEEEEPGAGRVLILGDGFWKRHYASAPDAIGRIIRVNDETFTIVGVMPPAFHIDLPEDEQVYAPLTVETSRNHGFLRIIGRLKAGVTLGQARADMALVAARIAAAYPKTNAGVSVNIVALPDALARSVRSGLLTMIAVVAVVLLIACTNVAGLMLARGTSRQREMALRAALGAGRGRLLRQLLTESLLLACAGGALGLLLADWTSRILAAVLAQQFNVPRVDATHTDVWVLGFTLALSIGTGVLFGVGPAWSSSSPDLNDALRDANRASTGPRAPRLRSGLVVVEIALALVLLAGAGVLLRTFLTLRSTAPGFESAHLMTLDLWLPQPRFAKLADRTEFHDAVLTRLRGLPGVRSAALVADLPLNGGSDSLGFHIAGRPDPAPGKSFTALFNVSSSAYFSTMGIPMREGREFTDADRSNTAGVVVINETAARTFWPGEDPVGQQILLPQSSTQYSSSTNQTLTVVGVTGDVRHIGLGTPPRAEIFMNTAQATVAWPWLVLAVRTQGDAALMADAAKRLVQEINPNVPIQRVNTMDDVIARSIVAPRIYSFLLGLFAALAVGLAAVGLYGLVSYSVAQRTHELGVRLALGATRAEMVRLVLKQGLTLAAVGAALGLAGAFAVTRLLVGLVKGVQPNNPATYFLVTLVLLLAALVASYLPARRAGRVDAMVALRAE